LAPIVVRRAVKGRSSGASPGIRSHRADYRKSTMLLDPRRGMSSDGIDRSSVAPRARGWIPTRRGAKMSGGVSPISTTGGTPSSTLRGYV
jgi:hypothetical protein